MQVDPASPNSRYWLRHTSPHPEEEITALQVLPSRMQHSAGAGQL